MKKGIAAAGVMMALVMIGTLSRPDRAAAREAASVCQFYKGTPLCKTVEEKNCIGVSVGVEGQSCTTTTEYWYWS